MTERIYNLVKNGKSEYVLLIPKRTNSYKDKYIDFAVKTFNELLRKSTGVSLSVSTSTVGKFVSIGNTDELKRLSLENDFGKDGFSVKEINGNLYLYGESDYGAIWAVQEFFERTVDYKFYALDEIKISKKSTIDITGFNVSYTPSIPNRSCGFSIAADVEYATGLKGLIGTGTLLDGTRLWGAEKLWVHNHVQLYIQPTKYYKEHPEWFVLEKNSFEIDPNKMKAGRMQLCLSNVELRAEFAKNLIIQIEKQPQVKYFLIGHEDNDSFCSCENCKKAIEKLGTSGLHMDFINDVARRVESWRVKNAPEREIYVGGLAYELTTSFKAPVKTINGEVVPVDDCVVAEKNVFMCFAPIFTPDHARSYSDELNKTLPKVLEKWKKVCNHFTVWLYYGSFRRNFEFVDGIYSIKENIDFYTNLGAKWFFLETSNEVGAFSFQAMTLYVLMRLQWNKNLDTNELIEEFGRNYYKVAWKYLKKYFKYCMDYFDKSRKRVQYLTGRPFLYGVCQRDTMPVGFWSLNAIYDLSLLLDQADKAIDNANYSLTLKEKMHDRIEIERLLLLHVQLEHFNHKLSDYDEMRTINTFPKEKILELCDRFEKDVEKFGIKEINGDGPAMKTIQGWRERALTTPRFWENRMLMHNQIFNSLDKD